MLKNKKSLRVLKVKSKLSECLVFLNKQRPSSYNIIGDWMNLVFEGGGIKGLSYIGAMRCLEERGIKVKSVAGSSVGALIASLIAVGYKAHELEIAVNNIDFETIWPIKKTRGIKKTFDFLKKRYIYDVHPLEKTLNELYRQKGISTFADLKKGNYYPLKIIVTNMKTKDIVVIPDDLFLYGINPDTFLISQAVCMSSAIPFVYPAYKINNFKFCDGGLGDNFPIWLFKDDVIGFRVNKDSKILNLLQRHFFHNHQNHHHPNLVYIDTSGYKTIDFLKGIKDRQILYNRGYYYTKIFLDKYFLNSENHKING